MNAQVDFEAPVQKLVLGKQGFPEASSSKCRAWPVMSFFPLESSLIPGLLRFILTPAFPHWARDPFPPTVVSPSGITSDHSPGTQVQGQRRPKPRGVVY